MYDHWSYTSCTRNNHRWCECKEKDEHAYHKTKKPMVTWSKRITLVYHLQWAHCGSMFACKTCSSITKPCTASSLNVTRLWFTVNVNTGKRWISSKSKLHTTNTNPNTHSVGRMLARWWIHYYILLASFCSTFVSFGPFFSLFSFYLLQPERRTLNCLRKNVKNVCHTTIELNPNQVDFLIIIIVMNIIS